MIVLVFIKVHGISSGEILLDAVFKNVLSFCCFKESALS